MTVHTEIPHLSVTLHVEWREGMTTQQETNLEQVHIPHVQTDRVIFPAFPLRAVVNMYKKR